MSSLSDSSSSSSIDDQTERTEKSWRPLTRQQRRVLGVLVEKAKTTPDAYPMTLNALTTGCNQKSNRSPLMNLSADEVQIVVDELRDMGAVAEVQAGGRVPKYKHYMYEWLGVDKYGLAVMTELLLRGEQTVGELRSRASRMQNIADQGQLRTILASLIEKDLLVELQPPGRGQTVTHNLYPPEELDGVRKRCAGGGAATSSSGSFAPTAAARGGPSSSGELRDLSDAVHELRDELRELRERVEQLEANQDG